MSSNDQDDDITVVASHSAEYAVSEPGSSPTGLKQVKLDCQRQKFYDVMLYNIIMLILWYI